jgi:hypothetical protein
VQPGQSGQQLPDLIFDVQKKSRFICFEKSCEKLFWIAINGRLHWKKLAEQNREKLWQDNNRRIQFAPPKFSFIQFSFITVELPLVIIYRYLWLPWSVFMLCECSYHETRSSFPSIIFSSLSLSLSLSSRSRYFHNCEMSDFRSRTHLSAKSQLCAQLYERERELYSDLPSLWSLLWSPDGEKWDSSRPEQR